MILDVFSLGRGDSSSRNIDTLNWSNHACTHETKRFDFPVGGLGAERLHPPHHRVYVLERAQENVEEVQLGPGRAGVADVDGRLGLEGRDRGGWQALLILQARPQEPGLFEVRPEADARRVQGKFWLELDNASAGSSLV